jgi:hypothetical protein
LNKKSFLNSNKSLLLPIKLMLPVLLLLHHFSRLRQCSLLRRNPLRRFHLLHLNRFYKIHQSKLNLWFLKYKFLNLMLNQKKIQLKVWHVISRKLRIKIRSLWIIWINYSKR